MEEEASHHGGGREEIKEMSQQESPITPDRGMRVSLATLVTVEAGRPQATKSMGLLSTHTSQEEPCTWG